MGRIITDIMESHKIHVPNHQPVNDVHFFVPCCMTHSASHAPMDFAIGGGYVQATAVTAGGDYPVGVFIATGRQPGVAANGGGSPSTPGAAAAGSSRRVSARARCAATDRRPAQRCT